MDRNELLTQADLNRVEKKVDQLFDLISNKNNSLPKILRSEQVCEFLNISPSSLQNLRNKNVLPYSKIEGTIYYKYEDVINLIEKNLIK